jgi:hypothetical protein
VALNGILLGRGALLSEVICDVGRRGTGGGGGRALGVACWC